MAKPKVVIYGIGEQYRIRKQYLEQVFDILGYSDSNKTDISNYIKPEELHSCRCEFVYITSIQYFDEIKRDLTGKYNVPEEKIIGEKDTCWYLENSLIRDEWVINKLMEIPKGKKLLDAGAGELRYKQYCAHLEYLSQDFGQYEPEKKIEGLHPDMWDTSKIDILSDITSIPMEDGSLDAILCTEVFEHIKNPLLALQEFSRLLKSKGTLLLTAPFCSLTHMAPYYFANGFSKYWYEANLSDCGFEILEIKAYGSYFDYLRQELLRLASVAQKYCPGTVEETKLYETITDSVMLLKRLSENDEKSSELLCFGYMVSAQKI